MASYYLIIVSVAIALLSTASISFFFVVLKVREGKSPRFSETSRNLTPSVTDLPPLSMIVTARNEEQVIANCIYSLLNQTYPNFEIIVVDDSSTDQTREIVKNIEQKDSRVRLLEAGKKPVGWVGKNWPCWRGFEVSKGGLLVFFDADSTYKPETVELCVRYFLTNGYDMFSISPRVKLHGVWSHSIIPFLSGIINLLYPMCEVNNPESKCAYVFGSFVLVKKAVYEKIDGHRGIRNRIVEDAAIAENAKYSGYKLRVEIGKEFASTEWESDFRSVFNGLERVSSHSIRNHGLVSILNAALLFFAVLYPLLYIAVFAFGFTAIQRGSSQAFPLLEAGLAASLAAILLMLAAAASELNFVSGKIGAYPFLYPLGCLIFILAILTTSIKISMGKGIEWKGASYPQAVVRNK